MNKENDYLYIVAIIIMAFLVVTYTNYSNNTVETNPIEYDLSAIKELRENRLDLLDKLLSCESGGQQFIEGDGGKSIGYYQWQHETLEDILGYKMSYEEYYSIVTDYEQIHKITYMTIFQKDESWRWRNCWNKINKNYE